MVFMNKIYHYTSLESLACILKSQKFRFSRMDKMNDPLEGDKAKSVAREMFCSSWTTSNNESLPLWKMYTDLKGIRIGLSKDLFLSTHGNVCFSKKIDQSYYEIAPINLSNLSKSVCYDIDRIYGPIPISYVSDIEKYNSIYEAEKNPISVINNKLAHWQHEQEIRFVCFPHSDGVTFLLNDPWSIKRGEELKETFIDIPFNINSLLNIEILKGPMFDIGKEILLQSLLEKYAPFAELKSSAIAIR